MRRQFGLRFRTNIVVIPLFVATLTIFVWLDYRHEVQAFTTVWQVASSAGERTPASVAPAAGFSTIARRSLSIHALHGAVTIVLLITATNAALTVLVLKPAAMHGV
jgi:hypothetical protein